MSGLTTSNPDNANPTVHKTGAEASSSRSRTRLADFLDVDEEEQLEEDTDDVNHGLTYSEDEEGGAAGSSNSDSGTEDIELIDSQEIFDLIRSTTDPEHPLTLEQLAVVSVQQCEVIHGSKPRVLVEFTPTIPHCSMATLIGLCLRVRLQRSLPDRFKIDLRVKPGSHESENSLNKQLNDKERVAAAMENNHLLEVVHNCLATAGQRGGGVTV